MAQMGRATRYQPGDWVTYAPFQYITGFEEGSTFLYIGTTHGVMRYNLISSTWELPYTLGNGLKNGYVLNLFWNSDNRELWVFTRGGLDIIHTISSRWEHIEHTAPLFQQSRRSIQVGTTSNRVYIKENGGTIHAFDRLTHQPQGSAGGDSEAIHWKIKKFAPSEYSTLVLNDLWSINQINKSLENEKFRSYPLNLQYTDSRNNLWIGTWGAGVILADPLTSMGNVLRRGPVSTPLGAIYHSTDGYWFGGLSSWYSGPPSVVGEPGISFWDTKSNTWKQYLQQDDYDIRDATIYDIDGDESGVWFGTDRGLLHYSLENQKWQRIKNSHLQTVQVYDVLVQDSTVWAATRSGLYSISNPDGSLREQIPLLDKKVITTYSLAMHAGRVFVGTDYGLAAVDPTSKLIYYYDEQGVTVPKEQFQFLRVYNVTATKDFLFYINDYGLYQLDIQRKKQIQLPKLGLYAQSVVRVIQADGNDLWVGLENGLGRYNVPRQQWRFYTTDDGLGSNMIYNIVVYAKNIWCATQSGATRFKYKEFSRE